MVAIGLMDAELRPSDRFTSDRAEFVRPGTESPTFTKFTATRSDVLAEESARQRLHSEAETLRTKAAERAASAPSPLTFTRLAQAHLALGETEGAIEAARASLSLAKGADSTDGIGAENEYHVTSLRIAAEILRDSGQAEYAYGILRSIASSRTLSMTLATLANELGRPHEALELLIGQEGPLLDSFRGYLLATLGQNQKAVASLRAALREHPDDADAAMNLSIALWVMGSKRKALNYALRATRTAPGRKDMSLRYLDLLLEVGDIASAAHEIARLDKAHVVPDAQFLVIQARAQLAKGATSKALALLDRALPMARAEENETLQGEIAANRETLRYDLGKIDRQGARRALIELMKRYPDNDAVLINYCHVAQRRADATEMRLMFERLESAMPAGRREYVRHQLAALEGDCAVAARAASDWFTNAPDDPSAAAAAVIWLGIGMDRWDEAVSIADFSLETGRASPVLINNAAYAYAMVGRTEDAKRIVAPLAGNFVARATLGLAHLAEGDLEGGMRLYREAADMADEDDKTSKEDWRGASRCLMTLYEGLVIRQLGLDRTANSTHLSALALPPVPLPEDWQDRPDFLRLWNICVRNSYVWPPFI